MTNKYLICLFHWLSMVILIFVVLLVLAQNELQGRHLTRESKEMEPKKETIYQHIVRKKIVQDETDARPVIRKKIIQPNNHFEVGATHTLMPLSLSSEYKKIATELYAESASLDFSKLRPKCGEQYNDIIFRASQRYKVDPALIKAIIMAESSYNPKAISRSGAKGLMQLMPRTAKALGVQNTFDPEVNVDAGVRYFRKLMNQFEGDIKLAVAAYNAGSRHVRNHNGIPPFKETRVYVCKVFGYYAHYRAEEMRSKQQI